MGGGVEGAGAGVLGVAAASHPLTCCHVVVLCFVVATAIAQTAMGQLDDRACGLQAMCVASISRPVIQSQYVNPARHRHSVAGRLVPKLPGGCDCFVLVG